MSSRVFNDGRSSPMTVVEMGDADGNFDSECFVRELGDPEYDPEAAAKKVYDDGYSSGRQALLRGETVVIDCDDMLGCPYCNGYTEYLQTDGGLIYFCFEGNCRRLHQPVIYRRENMIRMLIPPQHRRKFPASLMCVNCGQRVKRRYISTYECSTLDYMGCCQLPPKQRSSYRRRLN